MNDGAECRCRLVARALSVAVASNCASTRCTGHYSRHRFVLYALHAFVVSLWHHPLVKLIAMASAVGSDFTKTSILQPEMLQCVVLPDAQWESYS